MIPVRAIRLRRAFGGETAVDGVDLDVAAGEIHAVVGLNGAGKTTLMRLLLGMVRPDGGRCEILGVDVGSAGSEVWGRVGHMIETPFAYPELTVTENVVAAGRLHGMNTGEARAAGGLVIERFALGRWAGRRAKVLSLGNRQRLGLACSLIHAPDVIVLDEPSNSLDPAGVVFIRDLLLDSAEQSGCAVLVSSHHLDELARISRRISVLHRGRLVGAIDPDGIDIERRFFGLVHDAEARHNSEALHG